MDDKRQTEPKFRDEELQDAIDRLSIFWEKYGNQVLIFIMVVMLGYGGYSFFTTRSARAHEDAWSSLASTNTPPTLQALGDTTGNQTVRVLSYLRSGDAYLAEGSVPPSASATEADLSEKLELAASMYTKALSSTSNPAYQTNAKLGLAAVAESQEKFTEARALYNEVIKLAEQAKLPSAKQQAEERIALIPELETPLEFAPEPEAPAAATETTPENPAANETALETPKSPANTPAVEQPIPATPPAQQ